MNWFKIGKGVHQAVYCHPAYLTSVQSTSCKMLGWLKHKLESRLLGEISITSDMPVYHPYGRKQRGTKESPDESERGEWRAGLKLNIQETKIMASGPIISWQIDGETMETVRDFILGGSKITADGDWSHEIKKHLLLGRKVVTNLDSILKSKDITLPTKVRLVKAMVFPVVMYGCESWAIKKAEHWRIECFWTVVLEKTLERPLDCKEIQPVHPKGDQSWIFLKGLVLKLKLQYFGHLMQRVDSLEKTLMLWGIGGRRRRGR